MHTLLHTIGTEERSGVEDHPVWSGRSARAPRRPWQRRSDSDADPWSWHSSTVFRWCATMTRMAQRWRARGWGVG